MRTIALEEHCLTPGLRELLGAQIHPYYAVHRWPPALEARLLDIGEGRIAEMDARRHRHAGAVDGPAGARAQPRRRRQCPWRARSTTASPRRSPHIPDRFAGFAALPTADPEAAAAELARAVHELGFSRRDGQRPHAGALPRRSVLLADLRGRRGARGADLPAPDAAAEGGLRRLLRGLRRRRRLHARAPAPGAGTSRPGCTRSG